MFGSYQTKDDSIARAIGNISNGLAMRYARKYQEKQDALQHDRNVEIANIKAQQEADKLASEREFTAEQNRLNRNKDITIQGMRTKEDKKPEITYDTELARINEEANKAYQNGAYGSLQEAQKSIGLTSTIPELRQQYENLNKGGAYSYTEKQLKNMSDEELYEYDKLLKSTDLVSDYNHLDMVKERVKRRENPKKILFWDLK